MVQNAHRPTMSLWYDKTTGLNIDLCEDMTVLYINCTWSHTVRWNVVRIAVILITKRFRFRHSFRLDCGARMPLVKIIIIIGCASFHKQMTVRLKREEALGVWEEREEEIVGHNFRGLHWLIRALTVKWSECDLQSVDCLLRREIELGAII